MVSCSVGVGRGWLAESNGVDSEAFLLIIGLLSLAAATSDSVSGSGVIAGTGSIA